MGHGDDEDVALNDRLGALVGGSHLGRRPGGPGFVDRRIERVRGPTPVVVGHAGSQQDAQKVVRARVVGHPAQRPHRRRVIGQPREQRVERLVRHGDAQYVVQLPEHARVRHEAAGHVRNRGKPCAARVSGSGEQTPCGSNVLVRRVVVGGAARYARRHHARPGDRGVLAAQSDEALPVDRERKGLPDAHVVKGRVHRIEAEIGHAERRHRAQLAAQLSVVGDPGRVKATDRCVIEVAALECVDGAAAADAGFEVHRPNGGRPRPVAIVGGEGDLVGRLRLDPVRPADNRPEASGRRHDAEGRPCHDGDEVGGRIGQADFHVIAGGLEPDTGRSSRSAQVCGCPDDVAQQRREG